MSLCVGLDLSLTGTGVAASGLDLLTLKPKCTGVERLHWIRNQVVRLTRPAPRLVMIEDVFAGRNGSATIALAQLHGAVKVALYSNRVPFLVVSNQHIKMYATGNGAAAKAAVIAGAVKRLGIEPADDNQADAAWARALGCALLGQPVADLPQTHTRALANLRLPPTTGEPRP